MEEFDQLIKEKAEKKEFKFKFLYWFLFAKKAGFAVFSTMQWIAIVAISSSIVGGASYGTYKLVQHVRAKSNVTAPAQVNPSELEPLGLLLDTAQVESGSDSVIIEGSPVLREEKASCPPINKKPKKKEKKDQTEVKDSVIAPEIPVQKTYERIRILTIDPDTILTND